MKWKTEDIMSEQDYILDDETKENRPRKMGKERTRVLGWGVGISSFILVLLSIPIIAADSEQYSGGETAVLGYIITELLSIAFFSALAGVIIAIFPFRKYKYGDRLTNSFGICWMIIAGYRIVLFTIILL